MIDEEKSAGFKNLDSRRIPDAVKSCQASGKGY
jgi:hypothetical protein